MDVNSKGEITTGGGTTDSSIYLLYVSAATPILVLYYPDGTRIWGRSYVVTGSSATYVTAVSFLGTTSIAFMLNGGNVVGGIVDVDGTTLRTYHSDITTSTYTFNNGGVLADSSYNLLAVG